MFGGDIDNKTYAAFFDVLDLGVCKEWVELKHQEYQFDVEYRGVGLIHSKKGDIYLVGGEKDGEKRRDIMKYDPTNNVLNMIDMRLTKDAYFLQNQNFEEVEENVFYQFGNDSHELHCLSFVNQQQPTPGIFKRKEKNFISATLFNPKMPNVFKIDDSELFKH